MGTPLGAISLDLSQGAKETLSPEGSFGRGRAKKKPGKDQNVDQHMTDG